MIKINEVRIGNWFSYNGADEEMQIDANDFQYVINGHITDIEPIPLTEEWLVKLGFEKILWDDFTFFRNKGLDIEIHNGGFYANRKIENVHTLQNLYFALTGEELTIKN